MMRRAARSSARRASSTSATVAPRNWSTSPANCATVSPSGVWIRAPPHAPRWTVIRASPSSTRIASRKVGRDTPKRCMSSPSGASTSPSRSSPRTIWSRRRAATSSAAFGARTGVASITRASCALVGAAEHHLLLFELLDLFGRVAQLREDRRCAGRPGTRRPPGRASPTSRRAARPRRIVSNAGWSTSTTSPVSRRTGSVHVNSEWLASNASTQATPAGSQEVLPLAGGARREDVGEEGRRARRRCASRAASEAKRSSCGEVGAIERGDQGLPFALTRARPGRSSRRRPGRAGRARAGRGSPRRPPGASACPRSARSRRRTPARCRRSWWWRGTVPCRCGAGRRARGGSTRAPRARRWSRRRRVPRSRGNTTICASIQLRVLVNSGSSQRPP